MKTGEARKIHEFLTALAVLLLCAAGMILCAWGIGRALLLALEASL